MTEIFVFFDGFFCFFLRVDLQWFSVNSLEFVRQLLWVKRFEFCVEIWGVCLSCRVRSLGLLESKWGGSLEFFQDEIVYHSRGDPYDFGHNFEGSKFSFFLKFFGLFFRIFASDFFYAFDFWVHEFGHHFEVAEKLGRRGKCSFYYRDFYQFGKVLTRVESFRRFLRNWVDQFLVDSFFGRFFLCHFDALSQAYYLGYKNEEKKLGIIGNFLRKKLGKKLRKFWRKNR